MTKGEIAKSLYEQGLNCAQAVVLAFKEEMGLEENQLKKLIAGFGGGFGRQGLVCGAVSGMTMVVGYLMPENSEKLAVYERIKNACVLVKEQLGSLNCKELKEMNKTSCGDICKIVADITEKFI